MEIAFQTSRMPFLKRILQEVRNQEETAETIVPDSYPDIASIADSYAVAIIRGKDCRDGSITISGGIKGGIVYVPEDQSWPRTLEFYIPFTMKLEHADLTERAHVICSARVRSVDGRMINSRKAMLRVNLGCQVTAYEQAEETLYSLQTKPEQLQIRKKLYPMQLSLETSEKSFVISDTLELPASRPPISQIYKLCCQLELTDQKVVGNKAVFKGTATCKLLYLSEDNNLYLHQQQLPFSQYCELENDYDEETATILPVITGYDIEAEGQDSTRRALLTIHVLAQCTVSGIRTMELLEDAYCTRGTLNPQWQSYSLDSCLDRQNGLQTVRHHLTGDLQEILDNDFYVDFPTVEQAGDTARISVSVSFHVLGFDSQDHLCALTGKNETVQELPLSNRARCVPTAIPSGSCYASLLSDGAETRCDVALETMCYGGQPLQTLCGGSIEEGENDKGKPSVILRRASRNTELWDIAKDCSAREEAIRAANHLEGEQLSEDCLLLIPVG